MLVAGFLPQQGGAYGGAKLSIGLVAAALLGACAHQQPSVSEEKQVEKREVKETVAAVVPACPPGAPCEGDLAAGGIFKSRRVALIERNPAVRSYPGGDHAMPRGDAVACL
jgi:hypothetical protein